MNVSHSNTDNLNAVITIELSKPDYEENVKKSLRNYGNHANIPGFRRGHVPYGLLVKMYGNAVKADEVRKLVNESLFNYIIDNEFNILGEPMIDEEKSSADIEKADDFTFTFDIALAPEIDLTVDKSITIPYYNIAVSDEMVARQDEMLRARQGKQVDVDSLKDEGDMVKGSLVELENGAPKEGGMVVDSTIVSPKYVKGDEKAKFDNVKVGDKVVFNPNAACESSQAELSSMLNIDRETAANVKNDFEMTVTQIMHLEPAEHNQEFYDGVFGKDAVKSEEEYTARVKQMIAAQLAPESDYRFSFDARKVLEEKVGAVELPAAFLKRWLVATNEKYTAENIDEEYGKMEAELKWHLIKEHITEALEVEVDDNDLNALAMSITRGQFAQYGMGNLPDEMIAQYAQEMFKEKEAHNRLVEQATEAKLLNAIKAAVTIEEKEVSTEEFGKLFKD